MPRFPLRESETMTKEEKLTSVTIYLAKVVDHLQGVEDEHRAFVIRRPHTNSASSLQVSPDLQGETVLSGISEAITPPEIGKEHSDTSVGLDEVAKPSG